MVNLLASTAVIVIVCGSDGRAGGRAGKGLGRNAFGISQITQQEAHQKLGETQRHLIRKRYDNSLEKFEDTALHSMQKKT